MNVQPQKWEDIFTMAHLEEWQRLGREHVRRFGVAPDITGHEPLLWIPLLRACLKHGVPLLPANQFDPKTIAGENGPPGLV